MNEIIQKYKTYKHTVSTDDNSEFQKIKKNLESIQKQDLIGNLTVVNTAANNTLNNIIFMDPNEGTKGKDGKIINTVNNNNLLARLNEVVLSLKTQINAGLARQDQFILVGRITKVFNSLKIKYSHDLKYKNPNDIKRCQLIDNAEPVTNPMHSPENSPENSPEKQSSTSDLSSSTKLSPVDSLLPQHTKSSSSATSESSVSNTFDNPTNLVNNPLQSTQSSNSSSATLSPYDGSPLPQQTISSSSATSESSVSNPFDQFLSDKHPSDSDPLNYAPSSSLTKNNFAQLPNVLKSNSTYKKDTKIISPLHATGGSRKRRRRNKNKTNKKKYNVKYISKRRSRKSRRSRKRVLRNIKRL